MAHIDLDVQEVEFDYSSTPPTLKCKTKSGVELSIASRGLTAKDFADSRKAGVSWAIRFEIRNASAASRSSPVSVQSLDKPRLVSRAKLES